jgi:hypothetical protein
VEACLHPVFDVLGADVAQAPIIEIAGALRADPRHADDPPLRRRCLEGLHQLPVRRRAADPQPGAQLLRPQRLVVVAVHLENLVPLPVEGQDGSEPRSGQQAERVRPGLR